MSLADHGYHFNSEGKMVDKTSGKAFEFNVFANNLRKNQQRYEEIGNAVTEHVYNLLEEEGLEKRYFPVNNKDNRNKSFIYVTKDLSTSKKCLVLINGSGVVRAGQWARSVIINHDLYSGSMIPYIKQGISEGYSVLVMNTNENVRDGVHLLASHSAEEHARSVWEQFLTECKNVYVVAHSYGGVVVQELIENTPGFKTSVKKIALTDSVHFIRNTDSEDSSWFKERAVNWVSSRLPLDTNISERNLFNCKCVSAGTSEHVWTSAKSIESVFSWLGEVEYEDEMSAMEDSPNEGEKGMEESLNECKSGIEDSMNEGENSVVENLNKGEKGMEESLNEGKCGIEKSLNEGKTPVEENLNECKSMEENLNEDKKCVAENEGEGGMEKIEGERTASGKRRREDNDEVKLREDL